MPRKIQNTTKGHLVNVPLPNHAASYTVISHQFVIDYAYQALANAGFGIVEEEYRCTADGQIAQGIYKLNYNNDPELSMMFAWTNSYNKQVKFKCVVGAYINKTGSVMTCGDIGTWTRKHTGTADVETKATIDAHIQNANMYYDQLVADKNEMSNITMNKRKQSQMLGILFAEYQILTTEQASMVRDQMKKPLHVLTSTDTLWAFYNYVTLALQTSHPRTWMEDQRILHHFISEVNNFSAVNTVAPVVIEPTQEDEPMDPLYSIPGQTNILDQIEEITNAQLAEVTDPKVSDAFIGMDEDFEMMRDAFMEDLEDGEYEDDVIASEVSIVISEDKTFVEAHEEAMIEKVEEDTKVLETMVWGNNTTQEVELQEPDLDDLTTNETQEESEDFDLDFESFDDEDEDFSADFF
jgi:hypothetical protein